MTATIVTVSLTLALNSFGLGHEPADHHHPHHIKEDHILQPGPGLGWGFPNDNPDHYGWFDHGVDLPLGSDRTAEYYFPRYMAVPPEQMFIQTYYNPFETRGQRYIPYTGAGGDHPAGGPPPGAGTMPITPYTDEPDTPVVRVPPLSGTIEAGPLPSGGSGLTP
jgi:hypothetical protein